MKLTLTSILLVFSFSMVGCFGGGGGSSTPTTPVADSQKARMKNVNHKNAQAIQAIFSKSPMNKGNSNTGQSSLQQAFYSHLIGGLKNQQPDPQSSFPRSDVNEMQVKLNEEIDAQNCTIKLEDVSDVRMGDEVLPTFKLSISGPECPIEATARFSAQQIREGYFNGTIEMHYIAKTDEFKQATGHSESRFTMNISGGMEQKENTITMDMAMGGGGQAISITEGPYAYSQNAKMNLKFQIPNDSQKGPTFPSPSSTDLNFGVDGLAEENIRFQMAEIDAYLESRESFSDPNKSYYKLNGQNITKEEYQELAQLYRPDGMDGSGDSSSPTPFPGEEKYLSCTFKLYDAQQVSADELRRAMSSGTDYNYSYLDVIYHYANNGNPSPVDEGQLIHKNKTLTYKLYSQYDLAIAEFGPAHQTQKESLSIQFGFSGDYVTGDLDFTYRWTCHPQ